MGVTPLAKNAASIARRFATQAARTEYDCIVIGGGHNGLITAAYIAKSGLRTVVLERRHTVGGAAVTEEIHPGFRVSRCSYLLSLLRPSIIKELELYKHGLKFHKRNPSSFTPLPDRGPSDPQGYLLMGNDIRENQAEIAKFSKRDAERFPEYEHWLDRFSRAIELIIDSPPLDVHWNKSKSSPDFAKALASRLSKAKGRVEAILPLARALGTIGPTKVPEFFELMTAPAGKILSRWFDSEPLLSTLATDAVIGAWASPKTTPGTAYVLLHHVMGELDGSRGAWGIVYGGMGAISQSIASAAIAAGAEIRTSSSVKEILVDGAKDGKAIGVRLASGEEIRATKGVFSNATPKVTFLDLIASGTLPDKFESAVRSVSYESGTTKINLALSSLPNFKCLPNRADGNPHPHHQTTIHLGASSMEEIDQAYNEAVLSGAPSENPMIEMTIPSSVDRSIVNKDSTHVATLFIQYTPYKYFVDHPERKTAFAKKVIEIIDRRYAPGFAASVIHADILTPPDLEEEFGLTGGNIFHGALSVDQLYFARPTAQAPSGYSTPIDNLYLCGSGAHPGGGVMGAAGRNCALYFLRNLSQ
ncbi:hypothetical protein BJ742DRAFT_815800 [Cladochytrium replicatum]|nr:hypothetical protein BJ742DRAFT_815800 [Cladochytrium replicatum]